VRGDSNTAGYQLIYIISVNFCMSLNIATSSEKHFAQTMQCLSCQDTVVTVLKVNENIMY